MATHLEHNACAMVSPFVCNHAFIALCIQSCILVLIIRACNYRFTYGVCYLIIVAFNYMYLIIYVDKLPLYIWIHLFLHLFKNIFNDLFVYLCIPTH